MIEYRRRFEAVREAFLKADSRAPLLVAQIGEVVEIRGIRYADGNYTYGVGIVGPGSGENELNEFAEARRMGSSTERIHRYPYVKEAKQAAYVALRREDPHIILLLSEFHKDGSFYLKEIRPQNI